MSKLKCKTAIYCRLSHEDDRNSKVTNNSNSIENQLSFLRNYIKEHSDEFELVEEYIDDGISGMTYEREAFKKMIKDIECKKINTIIVKDFSRIGREQIQTLDFINKYVVVNNVRFISLSDNYDSNYGKESDSMYMSMKCLFNDAYCADISKKVRVALETKMKQGDFIGAIPSYGYKKDPNHKNKLIIDEDAADVVRRIFDMYLKGIGKQTIARELNKDNIPNPTRYKQNKMNKSVYNPNILASTDYWTYSTINHILKNEIYTGCMVQHKSKMMAYNIKKKINVPRDNWYIVEGTHEAIIDKDKFELVQSMLKNKGRQLDLNTNVSKYVGLFFCGDCNRAMNKFVSKPKKDNTRYISFKCGTYSKYGKDKCTIHSIKESELDALILENIKSEIATALDNKSCEYIRSKNLKAIRKKKHSNYEMIKEEINKCESKKITLLEYLAEKIITADDYKRYKESNDEKVAKLNEQLLSLEEELNNEDKQIKEYENWLNKLLQYKQIETLTREIIVSLIEKIYIFENDSEKEIEIKYRFKNPLKE